MRDIKLGVAVLLLAILTSLHTYVIIDLNHQINEQEETIVELQEDVERLNEIVTELNIIVK